MDSFSSSTYARPRITRNDAAKLPMLLNLPADSKLIKHGAHTIFSSASERTVWRVSPLDLADKLTENMKTIQQLNGDAGILFPFRDEVEFLSGFCVTRWPLVAHVEDERERGEALAETLLKLHAALLPTGLKRVDVMPRLDDRMTRIRALTGFHPSVFSALQDRVEALREPYAAMVASGATLLHGDAHAGNVMRFRGDPILIDLDDLCLGPAELDAIPTFVSGNRLQRRERWEGFKDVFGDIKDWEHLPAAVESRELSMILRTAAYWNHGEKYRSELLSRLSGSPVWRNV